MPKNYKNNRCQILLAEGFLSRYVGTFRNAGISKSDFLDKELLCHETMIEKIKE